MKKLMFIFILPFLMLSCQKDSGKSSSNNLETTFKFKANGILYQWDGSLAENASKGSVVQKTNSDNLFVGYLLMAMNNNASNSMAIAIETNSPLASQAYNQDITPATKNFGTEMALNDISYNVIKVGDYMHFTVTKIHDGYADGNFTAQFTKYNSTEKVVVTEGEFHNIKILN